MSDGRCGECGSESPAEIGLRVPPLTVCWWCGRAWAQGREGRTEGWFITYQSSRAHNTRGRKLWVVWQVDREARRTVPIGVIGWKGREDAISFLQTLLDSIAARSQPPGSYND